MVSAGITLWVLITILDAPDAYHLTIGESYPSKAECISHGEDLKNRAAKANQILTYLCPTRDETNGN